MRPQAIDELRVVDALGGKAMHEHDGRSTAALAVERSERTDARGNATLRESGASKHRPAVPLVGPDDLVEDVRSHLSSSIPRMANTSNFES